MENLQAAIDPPEPSQKEIILLSRKESLDNELSALETEQSDFADMLDDFVLIQKGLADDIIRDYDNRIRRRREELADMVGGTGYEL